MQPIALPAFSDNYIWLLSEGSEAVVVDPGDARPVVAWLDQHPGIRLVAILVTHHHADHTGGVADLQALTSASVYAPATECPQLMATRVRGGESLRLLNRSWQVMAVPGHTAGHVAYTCPDDPPLLFSGDTLFAAGCGRLFEGTPQHMWASLRALATLPDHTRVCAAHEYTLANLAFARAVEPESPALLARQQVCQQQRKQGLPTLPSTIGLEKLTNPFLRSHLPDVQRAASQWGLMHPEGDPTDPTLDTETRCFARLREWKNQFR